MKIEIIECTSSADLQVTINEFMSNKDTQVVDIKFTSHACSDEDYIASAFVAYITYYPKDYLKTQAKVLAKSLGDLIKND